MKVAKNVIQGVCLGMCSAIFAGCGGTGQDVGSASTHNQEFGGVAIDGYVARATVFIDTNNDGSRNGWEPFAFTDNDGYYSYNPLTDTDYCADDASAEQAQYCLRSNTAFSNVVIRIDGGYDVLTGEPFVGQMSRRISDIQSGNMSEVLISPITSLLTNIEDPDEQATVLEALGLTEDDLDVDYLNTDGNGAVNAGVLNAALKVHKVVAVLADRLTDTYRNIGDERGTPNDATALVYDALAARLIASNANFDTAVSNSTIVAQVLDLAEDGLRAVYQRRELTLPADMGSTASLQGFARVATVVRSVADVVNGVVPPDATDVTATDALGMARMVESVVIKALRETSTDSSIERLAQVVNNSDNTEFLQELLVTLRDPAANVSDLARHNFVDLNSALAAAVLPEGAMPFTQIGGMRIKVSDLDLGTAPNDLEDSEVEWYFHGDADDLSGSFTACVKHIDGGNSTTGALGEGGTRGEIVTGFWSLLGATEDNLDSFSLLITLEFLGSNYQAIIKPAGLEVINDETYERIRFDFDGEIKSWHSALGMSPIGDATIPTSNAECREALPSRVGL